MVTRSWNKQRLLEFLESWQKKANRTKMTDERKEVFLCNGGCSFLSLGFILSAKLLLYACLELV